MASPSLPQMPNIRPGRSAIIGGFFVGSVFFGTLSYLQWRQQRKESMSLLRPGVIPSWERRIKHFGSGGELPAHTSNEAFGHSGAVSPRRENNRAQHMLSSDHAKVDPETGAIYQPARHVADRGDGLAYTKRRFDLVPMSGHPNVSKGVEVVSKLE